MFNFFDNDYYLSQNRDVENNKLEAFHHYCHYGINECRLPSKFFEVLDTPASNLSQEDYLNKLENIHSEVISLTSCIDRISNFSSYTEPKSLALYDIEDIDLSKILIGRDIDDTYLDVLKSGFFDPIHYLSQLKEEEVLHALASPIRHFLIYGGMFGYSPSKAFDTDLYYRLYPDIKDAGYNPLVHYIYYGSKEGRLCVLDKRFKSSLQILNSTFDDAVECLPQLDMSSYTTKDKLSIPYIVSGRPSSTSEQLKFISEWLDGRYYEKIIFIPSLALGGSTKVAINTAESLCNTDSSAKPLVIATDQSGAFYTDVSENYDFLDISSNIVGIEDKQSFLVKLIELLAPRKVLNVNSSLLWDTLLNYSSYLSRNKELYVYLFCYDYSVNKVPLGYAQTHFPDVLEDITEVYVDNLAFKNELCSNLYLDDFDTQKIHVIYQESRYTGKCYSNNRVETKKILWASRICDQKNPKLLLDIAALLPEYIFHIYGGSYEEMLNYGQVTSNIEFKGSFNTYADIDINEFDLYLYTSLWDGIPTILIDLISSGIPVISTNAGGINEFGLHSNLTYLSKFVDPEDAVIKILKVMSDSKESHSGDVVNVLPITDKSQLKLWS